MNREQFKKAVEENYQVVLSLNNSMKAETGFAKQQFDIKKRYDIGYAVKLFDFKFDCIIMDLHVSEKSQTIFIAVREDCKCDKYYNCCDCGNDEDGCGCSGCWSCNACEHCLEEE